MIPRRFPHTCNELQNKLSSFSIKHQGFLNNPKLICWHLPVKIWDFQQHYRKYITWWHPRIKFSTSSSRSLGFSTTGATPYLWSNSDKMNSTSQCRHQISPRKIWNVCVYLYKDVCMYVIYTHKIVFCLTIKILSRNPRKPLFILIATGKRQKKQL